jgi:hypothetical protein
MSAAFDIEDRKRTEWLRAAEMRTLRMITDGASLPDILNHVCTSIDRQIAPWFTAILLMDPGRKTPVAQCRAEVPAGLGSRNHAPPGGCRHGLVWHCRMREDASPRDGYCDRIRWREEYRGPRPEERNTGGMVPADCDE